MAEILVGFREVTEVAACDCGAEFVMRTEDTDLFEHEAAHRAAGERFSMAVSTEFLPYVLCQVRPSILYAVLVDQSFVCFLDEAL